MGNIDSLPASLRKPLIYLITVISMLIWGASFSWFKVAMTFYRPLSVVFFRLVFASIALFIIIAVNKGRERIRPGDLKYFLLMAFCEPFLYFIGESYGLKHTSATLASVIIATIPLLTPIFTRFFFNERFHYLFLIGLFVSFAGVLLIIVSDFSGQSTYFGVLLLFLAVFSAIGYGLLVGKLGRSYNALTIVQYQSFYGGLFMLPLFIIVDGSHLHEYHFSWEALAPVLKLAILASTLAYIFLNMAIRRLGLTLTNVFTNLIPVFSVVAAYFILDEVVTPRKIIGITLVIAGLCLAQRSSLIPLGPVKDGGSSVPEGMY